MSDIVVVALISFAGTIVGSSFGIIASSKLTIYRIKELEKKVDKHNCVLERTFTIEEKQRVYERRISKIEDIMIRNRGK